MQEHREQHETLISDRYRLLKRLRRGGMSEVFLAFDEQTQQQVAIKLVSNGDGDCIKRLQREIHILRTLSHAHILPLLDDGTCGSSYYLVMPYMQRGNLRERLAQGKLTPQETGILLHQLTDALAYAHAHGIIHRDIKPSNILLHTDDANHLYLADFGIAKILEQGSDITQTGFLVGTPEYMAPELAEKPESACSDIYAVGVLLYQMLTGRLPFTGTTPLAVCWKHIKEQPTPPSSLNPEITPAIERVILCAMHKNPRLRFADAGALSLAYANALSGIDDTSGLRLVPSIDLPVLPPSQVIVRRAKKSYSAPLPAIPWQHRLSETARRGAASVAALLLLALPASLGFMVAHNDIQVSQPMAINRPFVGGTIAGNVLSPLTSAMPATAGGISSVRAATGDQDTDHAKKNLQNQGHRHHHEHGDRHRDD